MREDTQRAIIDPRKNSHQIWLLFPLRSRKIRFHLQNGRLAKTRVSIDAADSFIALFFFFLQKSITFWRDIVRRRKPFWISTDIRTVVDSDNYGARGSDLPGTISKPWKRKTNNHFGNRLFRLRANLHFPSPRAKVSRPYIDCRCGSLFPRSAPGAYSGFSLVWADKTALMEVSCKPDDNLVPRVWYDDERAILLKWQYT